MISLDGIPNNHNNFKIQNFIVLEKNGYKYFKEIDGDNVDNIFDKNLLNIYLDAFTETTINNVQLVYDDITEISVLKCEKNIINNLPNKLEKLTVKSSYCTELILSPINNETITHITLIKTNLNKFPDISQCTKLICLRLMDSALRSFSISYNLPTTLTELSLSGNVINNTNFNYSALNVNHLKKISLSDNALDVYKFPEQLIQKCNIRRQNPKKTAFVMRRNNINNMNINHFVYNLNENTNTNTNRHILNTSQTVHLSSVNKSVVESINVINKYIEKYELNNNTKYDIGNTSELSNFSVSRCLQFNNPPSDINNDLLLWTQKYNIDYENDIRKYPSKHGITDLKYEELFVLIWKIMNHLIDNNKFEKNAIFERLATEIIDSRGYCFIGRFNRLVNSLCGILDGVYVGISTSEEIQIEMGQIIKKLNENELYTFKDAYCDAYEVLRSSEDKSSWMSALMDLAPEPKEIVINKKIYLLDWDDIITIPEKNKKDKFEIKENIDIMDKKCKIGIYNKENIDDPITWITLE